MKEKNFTAEFRGFKRINAERNMRFIKKKSVKIRVPLRVNPRLNFRILPFFFFLFSLFSFTLYAQEAEETTEMPTEEDITAESGLPGEETAFINEPLSREKQRIEMEIKTSTLPELAAWCRSLGFSESGTRTELSRRLRAHYELPDPRFAAATSRKVITIESAKTSEYFKIEVTDEEYARLTGDVRLSLTDNDATHRIRAEEIIFNRTRNLLTARGQVVYEKEKGGTIETFRGENITVNIDDWSSVFLGGDSEHMLDSDGTAYLFSGMVISHTGEGVTILNKAKISNAKNKDALWSISASKLWLLPGSDFAFFNAILRVGEIPVMYLPFFYYPVDEIVFHPVIGYRSREGGFVQTTTYLIGRPRADSTEVSSITRILGDSADMEKERHGMFLRSTGRRVTDPQKTTLKALIDHYVNLGTYLGVDLTTPKKGILNPLDFSFGVGITRTVSLTSTGYTPYAPDYDGTSDWNRSNLFSQSVPFRYRMNLNGSISTPVQLGGLTWRLPYYSDPYVNRDFLKRSESMDWVNMIQQGAATDQSSSEDEIGSYEWNIAGNLTLPLRNLTPYVSRANISNLSTTLTFKTFRDNEVYRNNIESPGRYFYAPDKFIIYSISGSVSGTPMTFGEQNTASSGDEAPQNDDPLKDIGNPIPPWSNNDNAQEKTETDDKLIPPALTQRFDIPAFGNYKFDIDYQLNPTGTSELQFMNGNWQSYDQVSWSEARSVLTSFGGNGRVNFNLDHSTRIFSNVVTLSGRSTWSDYSYLNEEADIFLDSSGNVVAERIENMRRQQYSQTNYTTSYENNSTLRPLYQNPVFGQSNFNYTFRGTLVKSKRYETGMDSPELSPQWGSWVKEKLNEDIPGLNVHRFSSNLDANIMDNRQNISLSFDLPPLDGLVSTNATFRFWISETRMDLRIKKPEDSEEWKYDPFNFTEILRFGNISTFTYYMVYNPEENNGITTITSSLTLLGLSASFKALKTSKYEFVPVDASNKSLGGSWEQYGEPALSPSELSFGYKYNYKNVEIFKNRINLLLDINSTLTFDLLRQTNSNFQFQMGFTLGMGGFIDLKLSATSENNVIFRYLKNFPGMDSLTSMYMDGPQNNVFVDLFDSLNFFNESKRMRSGFKMKRFDLRAVHYLGDWTAEFGITMYPYMNNTHSIPRYEVTSDISFLVQWKPITEIKTDLKYEGQYDRWTKN